MSSRRPAAPLEPQSSSAAFVEAEKPEIPEVKRDNSFYDNFIERAANLKITPDEVKNLVDLQTSLRIDQINEQSMNKFKTLVKIATTDKYTNEFFDHVRDYPTDSAMALFNGHAAGFICCDLRTIRDTLYITSIAVLDKFSGRGIGGALLQHAIINIASQTELVKTIAVHIHKDNKDAIRLFNRFGFVLHKTAGIWDSYYGMQIYLRPANKTGAPDSPIAATPYKKFKVARGVERDDLRVAKINEISAKRFKALNQAILGKDYDTKLHQKVMESPNISAIVFLDDTPIGSMICEKWETGGLRLLEVMTMSVLDEHKESEEDVKKLFLDYAFEIAENSQDIHLLTYYVKEDHLATITQLAQSGFTFWLPIPQFYRQNTRNDVYYIKKTSRMETKTIVAEIAEETGIEETQRVQPLDLKFNVKSFDVSKLISLTHSLVIEDVTQDTIETLKELNAAISPESNSNELFRDVLNTSKVARIALFKGVPVGFIFAERKLNNNGSYHLSIVTIGVKADKQRYGIAGELIKHIDNLAQETEDIKFMTAFVQNKNDVATRLFERCDFERCSCPNHFGTYTGCFFFKSSQ